jgi:hypothetical protein
VLSACAEESSQARDRPSESGADLMQPDSIVSGQAPRSILMRRYFDNILETEMLLPIVVEETDAELVVVTLYKTSKFRKYEGGA